MNSKTIVLDDRELLELIINDYDRAKPEYRVTSYWKIAVERKLAEVKEKGLTHFRRDIYFTKGYSENIYPPFVQENPPLKQRVLDFFYSTWPFLLVFRNYKNRESKLVLERSVAYREKIVLMHMLLTRSQETCGDLSGVREFCVGDPEVIQVGTDPTTPNFVVQMVYYSLLRGYSASKAPARVLELGGGYGAFCDLFLQNALASNNFRYYFLFDIPPMVYISGQYLKARYGDRVLTYKDFVNSEKITENDVEGKIVVLPTFFIDRLDLNFDLFWNTASFQEMTRSVVRNYLAHIIPRCHYIFVSSKTVGHKRTKFKQEFDNFEMAGGKNDDDLPISYSWIEGELLRAGYVSLRKAERPLTNILFNMLYSNYTYGMYEQNR